jgi:catalase
MTKKKLTTASGRPYYEKQDSMTVGPKGLVLLQDYYLHEHIVGAMSQIEVPKRDEIINRQLQHFARADKELATKVANGLNFNFKA